MSDDDIILYCATHPQTETSLRCNRCNKPICVKCAVSTPTGYRCKECVRGQQKTFNTAEWYDYLFGFAVAFILSLIGSRLVSFIGFFTILLAPVAGVGIAEAARFVIRRRRSKRLYQVITIGAALGTLPTLLTALFTVLVFLPQGGFGFLLNLIWPAVYAFIVTTSVYYRLTGLRIGK